MMLRCLLLLCTACFLSAPALADEKSNGVISSDDSSKEAAKALDEFIARAMDEGLLDPIGNSADPAGDDGGKTPLAEICKAALGADFSYYKDFREYAQLAEMENGEDLPGDYQRIQARVSLGLYSEASNVIDTLGLEDSYLQNLTTLLENQSGSTASYFAQYAKCSPEANLWYAIAQLSAHNPSGVKGLQENISLFRSLPFQMQVDIASIVVPALDGYDQQLLANKLMSSFSKDDVKNSTGLQFSAALLDEDAEKQIDDFIVRPEFRLKALGAIVRRGDTLSTPQRELLLDEVVHIIEHETDERQLTIALKFALQEFGKRSNFAEMIALSKQPRLQSPAARNTIFLSLAKSISKGLESEDQLKLLSIIQALIDHADVLEDHPSTQIFYEPASRRARELGYVSLSERLTDKNLRNYEGYLQRAEYAFRNNDVAGVFAVADKFPGEPKFALLGAKSALKISDLEKLKGYQYRLLDHPDLALALIKEDAASSKWLVAEDVYHAAGSSSDMPTAAKAANILALRREAKAETIKSAVSLYSADDILSRSTKDLNPMNKDIN